MTVVHRQPAVMAWEVALAVGGSLTVVAVVVALVVVVAMCTDVSIGIIVDTKYVHL